MLTTVEFIFKVDFKMINKRYLNFYFSMWNYFHVQRIKFRENLIIIHGGYNFKTPNNSPVE